MRFALETQLVCMKCHAVAYRASTQRRQCRHVFMFIHSQFAPNAVMTIMSDLLRFIIIIVTSKRY